MNENSVNQKKAFKLLDKLGELGSQEIQKRYSIDNLKLLELLTYELSGEVISPESINKESFSELIIELRKIKKKWGRKLGDAIILADDKSKDMDINGAINLLEEFIKVCESPFHRKHAQSQKEYYIREKEKRN